MKQHFQIILNASAASILASAALAQEPSTPRTKDRPNYTYDGKSQTDKPNGRQADRLNGAAKSSELIGMTVKNYQDEKLGEVKDLAVDVESGRIVQVILSTGGFIGIGDTLTAVPPGALHHDVAQKVVHLDADKAKLSAAPKFEMSKWAESSDSAHLSAVYRHYGEESSFKYVHRGDALLDGQRNPSGQRNSGLQRNTDTERNTDAQRNSGLQGNTDAQRNSGLQGNTDAQRNSALQGNTDAQRKADTRLVTDTQRTETQRNTDAQRNTGTQRYNEGSGNTVSTRNADGTWDTNRRANESQSMIPEARLGQVQKASKLIGMAVQNLQGQKLGDVQNLLVDLSAGRVVAMIVSSGGFIGKADELSAIPPTAMRFSQDRNTLQLDASKETLSGTPHFKGTQWPDFSQASQAGGVYRAYGVEPYFTADTTADADNTRRNVRDRDDQTLTSFDQGSSQADVATTAQIRKEIIAGKNMSVNARNVKVITKDGRVTLRGPVNSAEEKLLIGNIANNIAQLENVDNQLEVK